MSVEKSEKLDYRKIQYAHPTYHMNRILQQSGDQSFNITSAGGEESIFEIPTNAFNLARSELSYTFKIPETNAAYVYNYKDVQSHIRQIQLYTRSGIFLCNLNEASNYSKIIQKTDVQLEDFLTFDSQASAVTEVLSNGVSTQLQRSTKQGVGIADNVALGIPLTVTAVVAATGVITFGTLGGLLISNFLRVGDSIFVSNANGSVSGRISAVVDPGTVTIGATTAVVAIGAITALVRYRNSNATAEQKRYDGTNLSIPATEPQYMEVGAIGANGTEGDLFGKVKYSLGMYKNTILALDKDIYANEILLLRVVWNATNRIYFVGNSSTNPASGPAPPAGAQVVTISKLQLFLATEKNREITNQLQQQVMTDGLTVLIPYVHSYKTNIGGTGPGTTNQSVSLRFNKGHGQRLQKIYHSIFNNAETSNTAYDNSNIKGSKCTSFYTMLNNNRLQEFDISPAEYEDYMLLKDKIVSSVLQNSNVYQYNWCWIDDFTENSNPDEDSIMKEINNLSVGIDLSKEQKWDIYCTVFLGTYNHYSYAVTQKMLTIGPSGITVL